MHKLLRIAALSVGLALGSVTTTNAAPMDMVLDFGGDTESLSLGDFLSFVPTNAGPATTFSHAYTFTATEDLVSLSTAFQFAPPGPSFGVADFTASWDGGGPSVVLTDGLGVGTGALATLTLFITSGDTRTLTLTGTTLAIGGNYGLTIQAVPLPAAFPLLASGLGLIGFAGWRRKRAARS